VGGGLQRPITYVATQYPAHVRANRCTAAAYEAAPSSGPPAPGPAPATSSPPPPPSLRSAAWNSECAAAMRGKEEARLPCRKGGPGPPLPLCGRPSACNACHVLIAPPYSRASTRQVLGEGWMEYGLCRIGWSHYVNPPSRQLSARRWAIRFDVALKAEAAGTGINHRVRGRVVCG